MDKFQKFAQTLAHDLKAPLIGMNGIIHLLSEEYGPRFDQQAKNYFGVLKEQTEILFDLIDETLEFATEQFEKSCTLFNVRDLIEEATLLIQPPPSIEIKILSSLPDLCFGRVQLMKVFLNLLSNAVRFVDVEHGEIQISCTEEKELFRFSVCDNGLGVMEKTSLVKNRSMDFNSIFTTKKPYHGLGLSIVRGIIELYQGEFKSDTSLEGGAKVDFTWPKTKPKRFLSTL